MVRTDIYTGSSSASFAREIQPKVKEINEINQTKRNTLISDGAGEIVLAEIQKEIDLLHKTDFQAVKILISSGVKDALEIDMLSKAMANDILESVKIRIKNIMRDNKGTVKKEEEVEDA